MASQTTLDILIRARDQASAPIKRVQNSGSSLGKSIATGVGTAVKRGAAVGAAALTGFAAVGVKTAADFDTTMRTISAVAEVPNKQLKQLEDLAIKQGEATVFSANESAQAILELSKAGVGTADIMSGALAESLALATVEGMDLATAATVTANAMAVFDLKGDQAKQVADALAGASNASSASVDTLAQALTAGGGAAAAAGKSVQETTAFLAAMAKAGIQGSDAGTSMKTFMLSLVPTSDKAKAAIKKLKLEFLDSEGSIRPLTEIAGELESKLGKLTQAKQQVALKTIFGTDAFRAAKVMMDQGAKGMAGFLAETSKVGTAQDVASKRMGGFAGMMESLKGSLETLALRVGQALLPALSDIVTGITPLINGLAPVFTSFAKALLPALKVIGEGLAPVFEVLSAAMVELGPVIEELAVVAVGMVEAFIPWVPVFADIAKIAAAILLPVLRALTPILPQIVLAMLAMKVAKGVAGDVRSLADSFKNAYGSGKKLVGGISRLAGGFRSAEVASSAASGRLGALGGKLRHPIRSIGDMGKAVGRTAVSMVKGVGNAAVGVGRGAVRIVKGVGRMSLAVGRSLVGVARGFGSLVLSVGRAGVSLLVSIGRVAAGVVVSGLSMIGSFLATAAAAVASAAATAAAWLVAAAPFILLGLIVAGVVVLIIKNWENLKRGLGTIWRGIKRAASAAWNGIKDAIGAALSGLKNLFLNATPIGLVIKHWHTIRDAVIGAWNKIKGAWSSAKKWFSSLWSGVKSVTSSIWNGIIGGIKGAINSVISLINTMIRGLNNTAIRGFNAISPKNIPQIPQIPALDTGGTVLKTGLAVVHRGEDWSGVGSHRRWGGPGGSLTVNLDRRRFTEQADYQLRYGGL